MSPDARSIQRRARALVSRGRDERVAQLRRRVARLRSRVDELEAEVQENARLGVRLEELTDIVQELLLPAAQRDEKRLAELLDTYRDKL